MWSACVLGALRPMLFGSQTIPDTQYGLRRITIGCNPRRQRLNEYIASCGCLTRFCLWVARCLGQKRSLPTKAGQPGFWQGLRAAVPIYLVASSSVSSSVSDSVLRKSRMILSAKAGASTSDRYMALIASWISRSLLTSHVNIAIQTNSLLAHAESLWRPAALVDSRY